MEPGESPLEAAKRLVRAVARAFYDDAVVAVLDALLRDRHLRDADMDQRMGGLSHKMVRRVLGELLEERLIKTEEVLDEASGKRDLYYYVDFAHFTNVVRYRVHLMHRELERMEREANDNQTYECPECGCNTSVLAAQPLRNRRFGFCCPTCCPAETHDGCEGDRWELRPKQAVAGFEEVQALKDRLRQQMYASSAEDGPAPHDGIYNLLSALERQPLPSNLPSELIAVGVAGGDGEGSGGGRRRGAGGGGGGGRGAGGSGAGIFEDLAAATRDGGIHADGEDGEGGDGGAGGFLNVVRPARAQPEFLRGSRVIKDDHDAAAASPTKGGGATGAAGAGGGAAGGAGAGSGSAAAQEHEALTEAQRIEAYKAAYVAALQKELAAGSGDGGGAGGGAAGASSAAAAAEQEEEDVDWEEGE